jgi:hypothetical protein
MSLYLASRQMSMASYQEFRGSRHWQPGLLHHMEGGYQVEDTRLPIQGASRMLVGIP